MFLNGVGSFNLMECLTIEVLPGSKSFQEKCKHTHVLDLKLLVAFEGPNHQSQISLAFVRYLLGLYFRAGILQTNLMILLEQHTLHFFIPILFTTYPHCWNYVGSGDCANLIV